MRAYEITRREEQAVKLKDGHRLTYTVSNEAWFWRRGSISVEDDIVISSSSTTETGVDWEFVIEAESLRTRNDAVRLRIFDEAFSAFTEVPELFEALALDPPTNLESVRAVLLSIGATDVTPRTKR